MRNLSIAQVYVIQNEIGLVKIGFANKPNNRIDSIAANSGLKIIRRHVSPPCFNFADIEKQLHQHFSYARKHGEWFDILFDQAVDALNAHFPSSVQSDNQSLTPFQFENHAVRTVIENDQTWFVAKDVCEILEIANVSQALGNLDDDEKGICKTYTLGGVQELLTINESGLYALVLRSNKPQAKVFRKWVTNEVLPSIRKTGGYGQVNLTPELQTFLRATIANEVNFALQSKAQSFQAPIAPQVYTLSLSERKIIDAISDGYITPKQIAHRIGKTRCNVTTRLRRMLKKGLIKQIDYGKYQVIEREGIL